ncbi:MAG TPA: CoA transferase [Candidatus Limnocylindria bacterium]|jgi:formyl-CoA transferase|nr:CoA transferase [Candidatus Limnocylindria bacterium]
MSSPPPLAGIRVLEVGNYMAGPFCGMQLADLGADVVKIEDPRGGDLSRRLEPLVDGESGNFVRINRGKRSVALDLKQEAGAQVFRELAARADVIVENLRPGTMRDLGLEAQSLLDANPRLIYASVTGWGLDGPYADRPALDIIVQAMSGLMSVTGEPGGAPVKVGVSISDLASGLYATIAVLAALSVRQRDGRGQLVDVSMYESSVSLAVWESGQFFTTGEVPRPAGSAHKLVGPYQAVRAADKHFVLGATTAPTWTAFCRALGLEHLERDPRFADGTLRRHDAGELIPLIEEVTATRPAAHWLAVLRAEGVPCGEIQDYREVFNDPHLRERGFFVDLPHPRLGTVRALGTPLRLRSSPARIERAGPLLGEHSEEVLREIGRSEDQVRALLARGAVVAA